MRRKDFHIGLEFSCGERRWRCTDVGSRVVIAIAIGPREIVHLEPDPERLGKHIERRYTKDDPTWYNGPPYAVAEQVFDEHSLEACFLTSEEE